MPQYRTKNYTSRRHARRENRKPKSDRIAREITKFFKDLGEGVVRKINEVIKYVLQRIKIKVGKTYITKIIKELNRNRVLMFGEDGISLMPEGWVEPALRLQASIGSLD